VVRVHQELLHSEKLPADVISDKIWKQRFQDICSYERYLARNGTVIRKFFLNVSRDEQRRRFLSRLEEKDKKWKFSVSDVAERKHWDEYMKAYEDAIEATSTDEAPWYVVPADRKWFTRLTVADVIVEALESLDLRYPDVGDAQRAELEKARALL